MKHFPDGFLWGTATSSHQVEGGQQNDWTRWESLGKTRDGNVSGLACDHWNRFAGDFDLAKTLGTNAHRFSIEWSRVEPEDGQWNDAALEHYAAVVQALRKRGLEPFVTLHHFTNPVWFAEQGGWTWKQAPERFARYVARVVEALPDVTDWITINEPEVYVELAYLTGYWPPERRSLVAAWMVRKNLVAAHRLAAEVISHVHPQAKVGAAVNLVAFDPLRSWNPINQLTVWLGHRLHNRWFLDRTHDTLDFIGINYYFRTRLSLKVYKPTDFFHGTVSPGVPTSDAGWEIYPEGLGRVVDFASSYGKPIYITENGIADASDGKRSQFIHDHLAILHRKIQEGHDIRGYFHWSLMDNFEWREGYAYRFGLVAVDFATQQRTIRPSGKAFAEICRSNALDGGGTA
ncbi:MAG: glycoside hydrolase family 1 protein [Candidatus Kerfeldbacteria bacterium]|nr:glycoside hydrolase family 1 protein [Candidatus Kerfeldbacteria bacterium]